MEKLTVTVRGACEALSISKTKFYDMLADGAPLRCVMVGRRRLITTESLRALIDSRATAIAEKEAD
jgi:excisionase family DNA binding protein